MLICTLCNKKSNRIAWSRHKKGSSGASEWPLRAQITKRTQRPNLHSFKGNRYCTKCLRIVKNLYNGALTSKKAVEVATPAIEVKTV